MSRFAVRVLPEAEAEMREAFLWYAERNLLIADGFGSEVSAAIDGLGDAAADWPQDADGVHWRPFLSSQTLSVHSVVRDCAR